MFSLKKWERQHWTNWSQSYMSAPSEKFAPRSIEEVCVFVRQQVESKKTIRVTGAAHSFSPVAMPEQSAMTLHHLRGLIEVDKAAQTATFYGGTYLHEIGPALAENGFALMNMGDIDEQTIAGAIATATHGTGIELGSIASTVTKWGLVNGLGEYVEHERSDDALSQALALSLGLFGILVKVTVKVIPLYSLTYTSDCQTVDETISTFQQIIREHRHVEWYYFPGSNQMQRKVMDIVPLQQQSELVRTIEQTKTTLFENKLFAIASAVVKARPILAPKISALSARLIPEGTRTDVSYKLFPTKRQVKFVETEYAIPLVHFEACIEEVHAHFQQRVFDVHFPIECRTTAGEQGFLSPTQGQESAFIAFHMLKGMNEQPYFNWVHKMMKKYEGRPHWGKMNCYDVVPISSFYPQAEQFELLRQQFDPHNVFMTTYFKRVFRF